MAKIKQLKGRFQGLHRCCVGISVISMVVAMVASATAGAEIGEITRRALIVFGVLWAAEYIIIKTWATIQDFQLAQARHNLSKQRRQ